MSTTPTSLQQIIAPAVDGTGMVLEEIKVTGEGEHCTLQVVVDRAEGTEGLDLDTLADVAGVVSSALDAAGDDLPEIGTVAYQLEVTSPGTARPLTTERHWRRNIGRTVTVSIDGAEQILARVESVEAETVGLVPIRLGAKKGMPTKEGALERHELTRLGPATIQVELTHGAPASSNGDAQQERHPVGAADDFSDTEA